LYRIMGDMTLHSRVNAILRMECTCCGPWLQGGSLVRGSISSCKTEFGVWTILILGTQMLYLVYISSTWWHVPTAPELMSSAYSHLAMQLLMLRRNWFQSWWLRNF